MAALKASETSKLPKSFFAWDDMLNMNKIGFFPYTPATQMLHGLVEGVEMLHEEGLDNVFARHNRLAEATRRAVRHWGVERVKLLALIAAPEGLRAVQAAHPSCEVYVCALDERLNERGYILPGLGDAGDRVFNARAG